MADILMHLPAHDRHKFQQMIIEAECSVVLKREGYKKRCRFCNDSLKGHPALSITSHDFLVGMHVCTKRDCLFKAPEVFIALRNKYLKEFRENPPLWAPGDPPPQLEDFKT